MIRGENGSKEPGRRTEWQRIFEETKEEERGPRLFKKEPCIAECKEVESPNKEIGQKTSPIVRRRGKGTRGGERHREKRRKARWKKVTMGSKPNKPSPRKDEKGKGCCERGYQSSSRGGCLRSLRGGGRGSGTGRGEKC